MSEMVTYTGKIVPVYQLKNETTKEYFCRVFNSYGVSKDIFEDRYYDGIKFSKLYYELEGSKLPDMYLLKDTIYISDMTYSYDDDYLFVSHINEDGSIDITTRFYNGGTCISEMIEDNLKFPLDTKVCI